MAIFVELTPTDDRADDVANARCFVCLRVIGHGGRVYKSTISKKLLHGHCLAGGVAMTELKKAVHRRTTLLTDNRMTARRRDRITVSLYPDQTIGFREHGRRTEYRLPLVACYKLAVIEHAKQNQKTRRRIRRANRGILRTEGGA